jgi:hypothetical protein
LPYLPEEVFGLDLNPVNRDLEIERSRMHGLLLLIDTFVEPRGLPNEDTPVKQFADYMKNELSQKYISDDLKTLWTYIQTDEGRSYWAKNENENSLSGYYDTVVWHQDHPIEMPLQVLKHIHACYKEINFCDEAFKKNKIENVELNQHLSRGFGTRLGYKKGESIPAYRYRIRTNSNYTNTTHANISVDVLIPLHDSSLKWKKDTPATIIVPRPRRYYDLNNIITYTYKLNTRLVRRFLLHKHGYNFLRYMKYEGDDFWRIREEADPFLDVSGTPFKTKDRALISDDKNDFSPLQGITLPQMEA